MMTSAQTSELNHAFEIFFGHNPKYPLWILVALYLRKENRLHIVENHIPNNQINNLIWDWKNGADISFANLSFPNSTLERWERSGVHNVSIIGDIERDEQLVAIVESFKQETASEKDKSLLFKPQWEPTFLLEVASILIGIDDKAFEYAQFDSIFDDLILRVFATSKFRGEYMQSKSLSDAISHFIHKVSSSEPVYNPCCGVGTLITADAPFIEYIGEEINPIICGIAQLRMKWHEYTFAKIICGNSLHSDISDFGIMVSTPPFESFSSRDTTNSILLNLIDKCLNLSKPGIFIVPAGFCFNHTYLSIRNKLITNDTLQGVIMLPAGLFAPFSGIQTAIIIINPNKPIKGKVSLIDATAFIDEATRDLKPTELEKAWDGESDFKVTIDNSHIIDMEYSFVPNYYLDMNIEVPKGAKLMSLNELGTFIKSYSKESKDGVRWATSTIFSNPNALKTYSIYEIAPGKSLPNSLVIDRDCVLILATGGRGVSIHIDEYGEIYTHRNNIAFIPNRKLILPEYLILELSKSYVTNRIFGTYTASLARNIDNIKIVVPSIESQKEAIGQYQSELLSQMGVEMSMLKTRREQESRQELETRKHRIGQILNDALPAFESLYEFVANTDEPLTRDTEVDALFHSTLFEEMTSIQRGLKKASLLLKSLTEEVKYSEATDIDFCDFVATCATELRPNKTNIFWFGELKEDERPVVRISEQDLKTIFENVFSNAKKYGFTESSRRDYFISVNFRCVDIDNNPFLRIHISNNGSPLPKGMNPERVFEWGKGNGHGIGGWQIRNIIEYFGGTVSLEELGNNPEGFTVRYVIHLPLTENTYE